MFLILVFVAIYSCNDFFIIVNTNKISGLYKFSSQTLEKSLVKNLDVTGHVMSDCAHYKNNTYLTTLIINGSVTSDLYIVNNNGITIGFSRYDTIDHPVVDNKGDLYAITIINRKFSIINVGLRTSFDIKYQTEDWLDMMFYDKMSKIIYFSCKYDSFMVSYFYYQKLEYF